MLLIVTIATTLKSQVNVFIDTNDSLTGIVTLITSDSSFFKQYYTGNINSIDTTPIETTYRIQTEPYPNTIIDYPKDFGGGMPSHLCYNPSNNCIYTFAGRKIFAIDATMHETVSKFDVSNIGTMFFDSMAENLPLVYEKRILYNPENQNVYCATNDGNVVVIDNTNNIIATLTYTTSGISKIIKSSLAYSDYDNNIYWMISDINGKNRVYKITGVSLSSNYYAYNKSFNAILPNPNENKIYISAIDKIIIIDNNLTYQYEFIGHIYGSMGYCNGSLYSDLIGEEQIVKITDTIENYINVLYNNIIHFEHNSDNNTPRIFFTGNDGHSFCLGVVDCINDSVIKYVDKNYLYSLVYSKSSEKAFAGGTCTGQLIGMDNNGIVEPTGTVDKTQLFDLTSIPDSNVLVSANIESGRVYFIDEMSAEPVDTVLTGGIIIEGCLKENFDKAFFAVKSNIYKGEIVVFNCNMEQLLNTTIQLDYDPVSIGANSSNDYVYVAGTEENGDGKISYINANTNQIEKEWPIGNEGQPKKVFAAPDGKIYIPVGGIDKLYIIDEMNDPLIKDLPTGFCYSDIKYYNSGIYIANKCGTSIILYKNDSITEVASSKPFISLCFDEIYNKCYASSINLITEYEVLPDGSLDLLNNVVVCSNANQLLSNPFDQKIYGLTETGIITYDSSYSYSFQNENYDMAFNPELNMVYVYNIKNYQFMVSLGILNCNSNIFDKYSTGLGYIYNNSWLVKHTDLIQFYPKMNKFYFSNFSLSCIGIINYQEDSYGLQNGWNWKSFPRMERVGNEPGFSETVLSRINYFPELELHLIENQGGFPYKDFANMIWDGSLNDVFSTNGYKFDMRLTDGTQPEIALHGAKLDPATEITIYPSQENWVGYFIEEAQMPEDAIPAYVWDDLTMVKAQYWTMIKTTSEPEWKVKGRVTTIHYGDMIILQTDAMVTFQWNQPQEAAEEMETIMTEYYSYEEQAAYLPIFVETDSTSDIEEIAILANGEVVGASVRLPNDTLVEVNAYLEDVPPGTPLEFETWTGYKSAPIEKGSYSVKNPFSGVYEKRYIYKGETAKYHIASLKSGTVAQLPACISEARCSPNPFSAETLFTFRLNATNSVSLCVFDLNGNRVCELMNGTFPAGYYKTSWDGTNNSGIRVENGIYIYKLITGNGYEVSGKIVLIK